MADLFGEAKEVAIGIHDDKLTNSDLDVVSPIPAFL